MTLLIEQFKRARMKSVPIIGIETPDPAATIKALASMECLKKAEAVVLQWDIVEGLTAVPGNKAGESWLTMVSKDVDERRNMTGNPVECLRLVRRLPQRAIVFVANAYRWIENEAVAQAAWNLRDLFKEDQRTLVLLSPTIKFPAELERDVIVLDEPLPGDEERKAIITSLIQGAGLVVPDSAIMQKAVEATRGLAAFPTEQVAAMSLTKDGLDLAEIWERKRKMIEQTRGLTFLKGPETFESIGGLAQAKQFGSAIFHGNAAPTCCVFLDEIEKMMAGATGGDLSGVSQDFLGVILSAMEDYGWTGQIAVGPPGSGKSLYAKALARTHHVPCLSMDLGAVKGSLVGQSEQQMRMMIKTVQAVAGDGAYFVATCNKLDALPPELRRRFRMGIWFFDLPDEQERNAIWLINLARYGLKTQPFPMHDGWTGADIRNVCEIAWRLKITVFDAAQYITPVCKSDPDAIERLRKAASGRFLSASYPGLYDKDRPATEPKGRRIA